MQDINRNVPFFDEKYLLKAGFCGKVILKIAYKNRINGASSRLI